MAVRTSAVLTSVGATGLWPWRLAAAMGEGLLGACCYVPGARLGLAGLYHREGLVRAWRCWALGRVRCFWLSFSHQLAPKKNKNKVQSNKLACRNDDLLSLPSVTLLPAGTLARPYVVQQ